MAAFALSELLPNKWRHIGVVLADAAVLVAVILAPVSARYGWQYGTWQWNFYTGAILQGLSFIGLLSLYFPPAHPYNLQPREVIKKLDYLGKKCQSRQILYHRLTTINRHVPFRCRSRSRSHGHCLD
jgi:MFS family permease